MKLFVEGGGDSQALRAACREGFTKFITAAGVIKRPRVVACGSREDAFDSYCTAVKLGEPAMLLVDSEAPVAQSCQQEDSARWQPWQHLKQRSGDEWDKPAGVADTDCHLMVQCMESWLVADRKTLASFFGHGFKENQLPPDSTAVESISKAALFEGLKRATKDCQGKGQYGKGEHSFKLLGLVNPAVVTAQAPWANRFVGELKKKMA